MLRESVSVFHAERDGVLARVLVRPSGESHELIAARVDLVRSGLALAVVLFGGFLGVCRCGKDDSDQEKNNRAGTSDPLEGVRGVMDRIEARGVLHLSLLRKSARIAFL